MSNSTLVVYTKMSPNNSGKRTKAIDRITPHCVVGQVTIERLGDIFARPARKASSNYGIGLDGKIGLFVDEDCRSWCSSSAPNDQRAVTIECASDNFEPYRFNNEVYKALAELCADICRRNSKKKVIWIADKAKALKYKPAADEMQFTVHRWFANKSCPGNWMFDRMQQLTDDVNALLGEAPAPFTPYIVRVSVQRLNIRKGPGTDTPVMDRCAPGLYTIVEEASGPGASKWGRLKSGAGWISLDYARKI